MRIPTHLAWSLAVALALCLLTTSVRAQTCGDGIVEEGEQCDDGDAVFHAGEYCTAECAFAPCGIPTNPTRTVPTGPSSPSRYTG